MAAKKKAPSDGYARHSTPAAIKARAARNKARAEAVKAGRVKKGDGKVVHHHVKAKRGKPTTAAAIKKAKTSVTTQSNNAKISNEER